MTTPLEEIELVRANLQSSAGPEAVIHLGDRVLTLESDGSAIRRVEDGHVASPERYPNRAEALEAANLHGIDDELAGLFAVQTESWYRQDIDKLVSIFTADAEIHPDPSWPEQTVYRNEAGVRQFYEGMFAIMGTGRYVIEEARRSGDLALVRNRQETAGVASGVPVENLFSLLLRLRDNRVARLEFYRQPSEAERAFAAAVAA